MRTAKVIIKAGQNHKQYWQDLWHYRELFYFLAWRDLLVRYKQTMIGISWALIRPLLTMIIFSLIFGKLAKLPAQGFPYPILVFAGILPWQFFANALSESSNSLIFNSNLIAKIYFPRLIIPVSTIIVSFVDFLISGIILFVLIIFYRLIPDWHLLTLPIFISITLIAAMGGGFWLAALNVEYRDFRFVVPFIIQLGLYISPVGFSTDIIPNQWRLLYSLNPMVSIIDGFRWSILGHDFQIYWQGFSLSILTVILLFVSGVWYFRKRECTFADVI